MVTMDEDGIPNVVPHDPFAEHAASLEDLATSVCSSPESERSLYIYLRASVTCAKSILETLHQPADSPLAKAITAAERRMTILVGCVSDRITRNSSVSSDVM